MPLYDFKCKADRCGQVFESLSRPWEPVKCPACGFYPCEKLLSAPGDYQIKGDNSSSTRPKRAGTMKK